MSTFIHLKKLFQTITKPFYKQVSIRTRNKLSAGAINIRTVIIIRAGGGAREKLFFFRKKSDSAENESFSILYNDTNYSLCLYNSECFCLS